MELQHLQYFQKVAECEHMTNASIELRIAQPALSRIIKDMEEELEVPLFDRNNKRISLNENGKILQECALQIEQHIRDLHNDLRQNTVLNHAQISILLKTTPTILPEILQNFTKKYPEIKICLLTFNEKIAESDVHTDFIIDCNSSPEQSDNVHTIFNEEMSLAVNKTHPLAGKKISLREAAQENFITLLPSTHNYRYFMKQCKKSGFTPNVILQTSDYYTIKQLVEANIGISFVARYSWGLSEEEISFAEILDPPCPNSIQIINTNSSMPPACEKFWNFIKKYRFIPHVAGS